MSPVLQFFDGVNLALHFMQPGSQKWLEIQNNLNQTMPQAIIQQIEIIQNINLWRRY